MNSGGSKWMKWIETLYLILDGVMILLIIAWLTLGAYWRFSEWGIKCSKTYLPNYGKGLFIFYQFNAAVAAMSLFWCICGCCAGYWSYYASLPARRY